MGVQTLMAMAAACATGAHAYTAWERVACPTAQNGNCAYTNTAGVDQAVDIFLQAEILDTSADRAEVRCVTDDNTVLCHRVWPLADTGSAADCFSILPAGATMTCTADAGVSFIDTQVSDLKGKVVDPTAHTIPSPLDGYTNTAAADEWVSLQIDADGSAGRHEMECRAADRPVCTYAVHGGIGGTSCNFVLPAGAALSCRVSAGGFQVAGVARAFTEQVVAGDAVAVTDFDCPAVTYPSPNLCDCEYDNNRDVDLAVTVSAESVDDNYNSFHCYIGMTNICAWGSNYDNNGNRGGCSFVLPAGETFMCQMQWGAASFGIVTAMPLTTSLWPAEAARVRGGRQAVKGLKSGPTGAARMLAADTQLFAKWKEVHNKTYTSAAEEATRFGNFRQHVTVAAKASGVRSEVPNHLADWSREEFETHLRGCAFTTPHAELPRAPAHRVITAEDVRNMPKSVDWRDSGLVSSVKDQGQCGSCWSYSTTGAVEGAWAKAGHGLQSLSEQYLVSCDVNDGNAGCGGGWPYKAIDFLAANGAITERSYPYVSGGGTAPGCEADGKERADAKVVSYYAVDQDEDAMAAAVAKYGPMSISLDAMTQLWWPYTGGIMTGCCNTAADHAVLIVGYGEEDGTKFWWIKNSWGESWGEGGYVRLERGTNACGITTAPVLAMVEGSAPTPPRPTPEPEPTPTPTPTPEPKPTGACPESAVVQRTVDGMTTCSFRNGTHGVVLPPAVVINPYCSYLASGSLGYGWDAAGLANTYACPQGFDSRPGQGTYLYCLLLEGSHGVHFPQGATADCAEMPHGRFSYSFPTPNL